jgi:hypothetical protein
MLDMVVSLMSGIALDLSRILGVSHMLRHGVNVPSGRRKRRNSCELCPDRVL